MLSIVDNRTHRRRMRAVLERSPTHGDIRAFFRRFQAALDGRGLVMRGITTDASPLYPTLRESRSPDRTATLESLHYARAG